jgi:hypothetical protein
MDHDLEANCPSERYLKTLRDKFLNALEAVCAHDPIKKTRLQELMGGSNGLFATLQEIQEETAKNQENPEYLFLNKLHTDIASRLIPTKKDDKKISLNDLKECIIHALTQTKIASDFKTAYTDKISKMVRAINKTLASCEGTWQWDAVMASMAVLLAFAACGALSVVMTQVVKESFFAHGGANLNSATRGLKKVANLVVNSPVSIDAASAAIVGSAASLRGLSSRYKKGRFIDINSRMKGQSRAADEGLVEYDPPAKRAKTTHPIMNVIGH